MGKIISQPKAPPAPVLPPEPVVEKAPEAPAGPTEDELRVQNLLRRRRGRLGTITTSLSGALSAAAETAKAGTPVRKTLLGE
jgi:hypothetical protein